MALPRMTSLAAAVALALLIPLTAIAPVQGATRMTPPPPDQLTGVSCPQPNVCLAVGERADGTKGALAERWNGKRWRVLATPTLTGPGGRSGLGNVSCVSTSRCVALGLRARTAVGPSTAIAEEWNGARWRLLHVRFPRGSFPVGISCVRRACMIVGQRLVGPSGRISALADLLTGTRLRLLKPAVAKGSVGGFLTGVSCTSDVFCAAVGGQALPNVGGTINLAETWNGRTWRVRRTPHVAKFDTVLEAVSCASPDLCMAGGAPVAGLRPPMTSYLLWRHGRWRTLRADRELAGPPDVPAGFSCPTVTRCVGTEYGLNSTHSAALTWIGGRTLGVHRVRQPAIGALFSISCPQPARCIAVGGFGRGAGTRNGAFSELWNGRRWSLLT